MYFQERVVKHICPDREVKGNEGSCPHSYKIIHSPYLWTFKDLIQLLPTFGQMKDKSLISKRPRHFKLSILRAGRAEASSLSVLLKGVSPLFQKLWLESHFLSLQVHSLTLSSALSTLNNENNDKASGVLLPPLRNKPATSQAFAQLLLSFSERHSTLEVSTSRVTKSGA